MKTDKTKTLKKTTMREARYVYLNWLRLNKERFKRHRKPMSFERYLHEVYGG